jgi:ABC-type enterochelin transport system permease subunit
MVTVTIVIGAILAFLVALLFLGLWAARRFSKKLPASELSREMHATDFIQAIVVVVVCSAIFIVYELAPATPIGRLLNKPFGLAVGLTLGCIGTPIAYALVVLATRRIRRSGNA